MVSTVRKTVTILFCDVTGSTALGEELDPESLREVIHRYFTEMRAVIEDWATSPTAGSTEIAPQQGSGPLRQTFLSQAVNPVLRPEGVEPPQVLYTR
jgi:class 3 adenylate cyclase